MLDEKFIIIALLLNVYGGGSYLISTLRGKTKPNKITWFVWALAPLIAFIAEIKQGVRLHSLFTFIIGFNPLIIFLASFINKKAYWKISRLDIICGLLAFGGLILWQITRIGNFAIAFSILADGLAAIPTIIKSIKFPETENDKAFLMAGLSALITLLTIDIWNFEYFGFPLYVFLICLLFFSLIHFKLGKRFNLLQKV